MDRVRELHGVGEVNGTVLVVGGDGLIGSALVDYLHVRGVSVLATTRREESLRKNRVWLDLNEAGAFDCPKNVGAVVFCAAATNLSFCRDHPDDARRINVDRTLRVAEACARVGAAVTFLSTTLVFDGSLAQTPADASRTPKSVYGVLKADAELGLQRRIKQLSIIRLAKVFSPKMPLLQAWRRRLRNGQPVEAFSDYRCAPIDLPTVVAGIAKIIQQQCQGVWQFSPQLDVTYAQIARETARRLSVDPNLVKAIPSTAKVQLEHIPKHTTLDASRSCEVLGLQFPGMSVVLDRVWNESGLLIDERDEMSLL